MSIRKIATGLGISRSAVERDLRLARRFAEAGNDVTAMAHRVVAKARGDLGTGGASAREVGG